MLVQQKELNIEDTIVLNSVYPNNNDSAKTKVKKIVKKKQESRCTLSKKRLKSPLNLTDAHLLDNELLTEANIEVVTPVDHMKKHGNYRERTPEFCELKSIIDDREQVRKLFTKINNQILAYKRETDKVNEVTLNWLMAQLKDLQVELKARDKQLALFINKIATNNALVRSILDVKGIGPVTASYCMVYIDFSLARHASCLWSYTGLHVPAHARYTKGIRGGGNRTLRTMLRTMADSQLKTRGAYRSVYDNMRQRLDNSDAETTTRLSLKDGGQLVKKAWKDVYPKHRHDASLRAIMKHFLADLWMIGRRYYELETSALYPEAILKGTHRTIQPEERGWVLECTVSQEVNQG